MQGYERIARCKICAGAQFRPLTAAPAVNYVECAGCGVIFLNPQPTVQTLKQQYTRAGLLESGPASAWFQKKLYFVRQAARDRLQEVRRYIRQGDLLDVGCGMGDFCAVARGAGFRVFGTEFSDAYADHTTQVVGLQDIFIGRLQDIDFGGRQFDVITLWHVLEHLPDPLETLICLRRVLKPGGVLGVEVPNTEQARARPMYRSDLEDYPLDRLEHLFYYSERSLQHLCERAGFHRLAVTFVDAHQPARHLLKLLLRKIKRPAKQVWYWGRWHRGFSALRMWLTV